MQPASYPGDRSHLLLRAVLAITAGGPLLVLAGTQMAVWIAPASVAGGSWVKLAVMLVILEFLLLHSGAFMSLGPLMFANRGYRFAWFLGFGLFYALMIWGASSYVDGHYVAWLLGVVMVSRLFTLVLLDDRRGTLVMFVRSAIGMTLLVLTTLLCLLPWPELGLDEAVRYRVFGSQDDTLSESPQRFIAWGIGYFTLMGLVECFIGWRMPDWTDEQVDNAWQSMRRRPAN